MAGHRGEAVAHARDEVLEAVEAGAPIDAVEERLATNRRLGGEDRSALWLLAWATTERNQIRRWRAEFGRIAGPPGRRARA